MRAPTDQYDGVVDSSDATDMEVVTADSRRPRSKYASAAVIALLACAGTAAVFRMRGGPAMRGTSAPQPVSAKKATPSSVSKKSAGSCCALHQNDTCWGDCAMWGDPHVTSAFGKTPFNMFGYGVFKAAATESGDFVVQNMQCMYNGSTDAPGVQVGVAIKFGANVVVLANNKMYLDGVEVTDDNEVELLGQTSIYIAQTGGTDNPSNFKPTDTWEAHNANPKFAGWMKRSFTLASDDCCYRVHIQHNKYKGKAPGHWVDFHAEIPGNEVDQTAGICGVGKQYKVQEGVDSLLFTDELMTELCSVCSDPKPPQCAGNPPSPAPDDAIQEHTSREVCEKKQKRYRNGCAGYKADAQDLFQVGKTKCEAAGVSEECVEDCIFDFCASDCDDEVVEEAHEACAITSRQATLDAENQACRESNSASDGERGVMSITTTLGLPPAPTSPGQCCDMEDSRTCWGDCAMWGDSHVTEAFGKTKFDMFGYGVFKAASTKTGDFQMQNLQCVYNVQYNGGVGAPGVQIGVAIRFQSHVITLFNSTMYLDGVEVTDENEAQVFHDTNIYLQSIGETSNPSNFKQSDTWEAHNSNPNFAGWMKRAYSIASTDCCYRVHIQHNKYKGKAPGHWVDFHAEIPGNEVDEAAGICGVGKEYNIQEGMDDIIFPPEIFSVMCDACSEPKPPQCTGKASPSPAPDNTITEHSPQEICEKQKRYRRGCAPYKAEQKDLYLEGQAKCQAAGVKAECEEDCILDFCASDCDDKVVTEAKEACEAGPAACLMIGGNRYEDNWGNSVTIAQDGCTATFNYDGNDMSAALEGNKMHISGWATGTVSKDGHVEFHDGGKWWLKKFSNRCRTTAPRKPDPTPAPGPPATPEGTCCELEDTDTCWGDCAMWGDLHVRSAYGKQGFNMFGYGVFKATATTAGDFEIQNMQCMYNEEDDAPFVQVGVAIKFSQNIVQLANNKMYLNGEEVTNENEEELFSKTNLYIMSTGNTSNSSNFKPTDTWEAHNSNSKFAGWMKRSFTIASTDCCYRVHIQHNKWESKAPGHWVDFHAELPSGEVDMEAGICGVGKEYKVQEGVDSLLFSEPLMTELCSICTDPKPPQCTGSPPSPALDHTIVEHTPHEVCEKKQKRYRHGCAPYKDKDLYQMGKDKCEGAGIRPDCAEDCIFEFCASDCDDEVAAEAKEACSGARRPEPEPAAQCRSATP